MLTANMRLYCAIRKAVLSNCACSAEQKCYFMQCYITDKLQDYKRVTLLFYNVDVINGSSLRLFEASSCERGHL